MNQCDKYRLLMSVTEKGNNEKIVTQDTFNSVEDAYNAVKNILIDLKDIHRNLIHENIQLFDEAIEQEDGIKYIGELKGRFRGGKFYIRIITTEGEPGDILEAEEIQGYFYELSINNLGEFKFLFKKNVLEETAEENYLMEVFWNPEDYGVTDFIVGQYVDDIELTMEKVKSNMDYYIDGARVACLCRIESGHDDEGVYESILNEFFDEKYEQEEEVSDCCVCNNYDSDKDVCKLGIILEEDQEVEECERFDFYLKLTLSKKGQLKEEIKEIIDGIEDDNDLETIWKFIQENFEIVMTQEDRKAFERGEEEIKKGE